jgi:hypothetical protein
LGEVPRAPVWVLLSVPLVSVFCSISNQIPIKNALVLPSEFSAFLLGFVLNLVQVQKWSSALEKTTDFELDLVSEK